VLDDGRELFRFKDQNDLIERIKPLAYASPGQCFGHRLMDITDYQQIETRLWDEDRMAMRHRTANTLVTPTPELEGQGRFPDGPPWDVMVTDKELKDAAALRSSARSSSG